MCYEPSRSGTGTVLTRALPETTAPGNVRLARTPALSPRGSLHGRMREAGVTPLSAVRARASGVPTTPQRVVGLETGLRAVRGLVPPPAEIRSHAMVGHLTTDSTLWADTDGCVWQRIPVIHRATGAFAMLFGGIICGGAGVLLQAFEADYMPLAEVFPTVPGYTASMEGAMAGVVLQLQAAHHTVFPPGLSYATNCDGI